MRKVTYGAACSLDGFIAAPDGSVDWLHYSADVAKIMAAYWADVDTILMGRKTWEVALAMGPGPSGLGTMKTCVFSRTLRTVPEGVELVAEDAGGFVRALKARPGKGICLMGGGLLAQALFQAGVIDEVGVNIQPLLLGTGVPLFRDAGRIGLELEESRTLDGGCVYAIYRVKPPRAPA